jgi:hypothetical protein
MRKFGIVFKEKQNISEKKQEQKLLGQFKSIYSLLLENYGVSEFYDLDKSLQNAFLTELNKYWTEEEGLLSKGQKFLNTRQSTITEASTEFQKQMFLKQKSTQIIKEVLRQSNVKTSLYKVLDEMYRRTNSSDISEVLPATTISAVLIESFGNSLQDLMTEIVYEITDSNELNEREFLKKKKN